RDCDDCRQELVLVVSAGAALRSAVRFAPQLVLEPVEEGLPDPSGFLAELAAERSATDGLPAAARQTDPTAGSGAQPGPGPDARPIPQARHEPETRRSGPAGPGAPGEIGEIGEIGERHSTRSGRRQPGRHTGPPGRRRWWAAAAAAVLLLAGIGSGV